MSSVWKDKPIPRIIHHWKRMNKWHTKLFYRLLNSSIACLDKLQEEHAEENWSIVITNPVGGRVEGLFVKYTSVKL
jgi:hypothetical protein